MEKFQISDETINKILLHTAMTLPDRPSERGMKASELKPYFYSFIRKLADAVNLELRYICDGVNESISGHNSSAQAHGSLIKSLEEKDTELGDSITNQIKTHNESSEAHEDIRTKIGTDIGTHNESSKAHEDIRTKIGTDIATHNESNAAHSDIRKLLGEIQEKANSAFNLANGKSKIHPMFSSEQFIHSVRNEPEKYNIGDTFVFYEKSMPDLVLYEKEWEYNEGYDDVNLSDGNYLPEGFEFKPGVRIFVNGMLFVGQESGVDVSKLVTDEELKSTKEALEALISALDERADEIVENAKEIVSDAQKRAEEVDSALALKESVFLQEESIQSEITLKNHTEYSLGLVTVLALGLPESIEGMESIINFRTGATAPSFDAPSELVFSGDDCSGGRFYPITHRIYEINIKEVMGILSARVGATDYEVIE